MYKTMNEHELVNKEKRKTHLFEFSTSCTESLEVANVGSKKGRMRGFYLLIPTCYND